ncbi:MAG TPA: class I adenylate-forming enzyme family protein, partial [Solimonas sp.]
MHFNRYVSFWSRRRGDALAIACNDERISWRELDRASAALAGYLQEQGLQRGDRFGCLLGNGIPWVVAYVASLRLGTIFVPLNSMFGRFELEQIVADAECSAVLSCPAQVSKLGLTDDSAPQERPRVYFLKAGTAPADYADILAAGRAFSDPILPDDDVMAICYTSGTTGVPKGAALTHRAVDAAMQGLVLNFGLRGGEERLLILAPLAFTGGVISNLAVMIVLGAGAFVETTVDPARAYKLLTEEGITYFGGVPALWERIAMAPGFETADLSSLRAAFTGGAPVPKPLLEKFLAKGVTIRQQYGFTEGCAGVSSPDAATAAADPGSCGQPLPGIELEIRNDAGQRTAPGEVGEVHARGLQLMQGYWNKPEATRESFDGEWYRTGDLGHYGEAGDIRIVDRKKNMLISGGVNIYPAEVERALAQIPGVVETLVLGLPSERWGQEVAAIVYGPSITDGSGVLERAR